MLMQTQNVPPAPPPLPPSSGQDNPYDFLNTPAKKKRSLLPTGNSKKQRLIIALVGAVILFILVVVIVGILSSSNQGAKQDLLSLQQQQTEILRVADIGIKQANQADTKSLAVTAKFTITSQQGQVASIAKKAGVKPSKKELAAGKNSNTDATLTAAAQSNQFDQVFTTVLKTSLLNYRRNLEKVRTEISGNKSRATLKAYDDQVVLLVPDEFAPASQ